MNEAEEIARKIDPTCDCEIFYSGDCTHCIVRKEDVVPIIAEAMATRDKRIGELEAEKDKSNENWQKIVKYELATTEIGHAEEITALKAQLEENKATESWAKSDYEALKAENERLKSRPEFKENFTDVSELSRKIEDFKAENERLKNRLDNPLDGGNWKDPLAWDKIKALQGALKDSEELFHQESSLRKQHVKEIETLEGALREADVSFKFIKDKEHDIWESGDCGNWDLVNDDIYQRCVKAITTIKRLLGDGDDGKNLHK